MAVRRAHHGILNALIAESSDTSSPFSLDRAPSFEGILAALDPQVSWRTPGPPDLPTAGLRHGVSAVREFFALLLNTFDIADFQPDDFLAAGDMVVVLGTSREGPKGSGRLVDFRWVHVFTFRNGRIVAFEEPADVSDLVMEFRRSQHTPKWTDLRADHSGPTDAKSP